MFTTEEVPLSEVGLQRVRERVETMHFTERSFKGCQECAHEVKTEEGSVVWSSRPTRRWVEPSHCVLDCRDRGGGSPLRPGRGKRKTSFVVGNRAVVSYLEAPVCDECKRRVW